MKCKLKHKSSEKNAKEYLVQYGVIADIDSTNILSGELFNQAVDQLTVSSSRAYSVPGIPFTNNKGQLETNKELFKQIDAIRKGLGLYDSQEPHSLNQDGVVMSVPLAEPLLPTTPDGIKPGVNELFESNPELANEVYEVLGFEISTTKLQGRKAVEGKLVNFDIIEELASGERSNLPSSILIKKLLNDGYLPRINEIDIVLGGLEYGIWRPSIKKIEAQGENKSTLVKKIGHELLHSVTHNIIYSYQALKGDFDFSTKYNVDNIRQGYIKPVELNETQIEALDNLVRLRNRVIDYINENKESLKKEDRGFGTYDYFIRTNYTNTNTDLHEFISEVFTNPELINILKQIPSEGKKSNLFKDFINAISKILGFTNTSILEDVIAYSEEAFFQQSQITPQQKQQAQQLYSQYLSNFVNTNFDSIITDLQSKKLLEKKCN